MRPIRLTIVLLLAPTLAHAQSAKQIYTSNCVSCHQANGAGGGAGTSSLLDDDWETDGSYRAQFDAVKNGMPDHGMPAYGKTLTDAQVWAVVNYIQELRKQHRQAQPDFGPAKLADGRYQTDHLTYRIEELVTDQIKIPWSVAFLPDGAMLIADRPGDIRLFKAGRLSPPIQGTPVVKAAGQGGMLDVQPHPDYADNRWIYLSYSHPLDDNPRNAMTRIVRGRITPDNRWVDQQTIWQARPEHYLPTRHHYGCRLVFDGKGHLYFCIGDRGRKPLAQDLSRPSGKVFRIKDDGAIPQDNPFVNTPNAYPAIWSFGHRNPQGLALHPQTNTLWLTEHGPRGGDELNQVIKGKNYGWPVVSFGINYSGSPLATPWPAKDQDLVMPTYVWLPSIAVCGLDVVQGKPFEKWQGDLLAGGLAGNAIDRIRIKDGRPVEVERIVQGLGRVRDVALGPDGHIYIALNGPDKIIRLVPSD
jgi:glucose/arabinose dehydrogenase